jgi:23S rRNA (adenine2503-C2)-methyltransferase
LYDLSRPDLERLVAALGEPRYRADQLWHWLYARLASSFGEMTNLPASLRQRLGDSAVLHTMAPVGASDSDDGLAGKTLFRLSDGQLIETVLMHYLDPADGNREDADGPEPGGRHTVCLSTQVGCAMGCVFCATGQMGLVRELSRGECVEQLVFLARGLRQAGARLTNVVFMGMGEPLANWDATWGTVGTLIDPDGFGLGARRLTISTVGLVPGIERLAKADKPVRLAVSVHAADDDLRDRLVPVNRTYPLGDVLRACRAYQAAGGRRITFEYVLIDGVNDAPEHASRLAGRLRGLVAHVNLIPLNPTAGSPMRPSPHRRAVAFEAVLRRAGLPTTMRMRRGIEIDAGCGQLRSRITDGRMGRTIRVGEQAR